MKKTSLIILDGWGHGKQNESNAIFLAKTPFIDNLYKEKLNTELFTHGQYVGLPNGQMGNSEVGHLNIGAGRIVYQNLTKINKEIKEKQLAQNKILKEAIDKAIINKKPIHLIGLASSGGIHSHINHLKAICEIKEIEEVNKVFIHAFTDGRDTDPKTAITEIKELREFIKNKKIQIATTIGRYYAMDRDNRWDRTHIAYNAIVHGNGTKTKDIINSIKKSYQRKITDEFIEPIIKVDKNNHPIGKIENGDIVICFNFRSDRCRQIVSSLTQKNFPNKQMKKLDIELYTMTNYDKNFKNIKAIFPNENIKNTLGEVIAKNGLQQLRIAETEKYPHVTYFFSGGNEDLFNNENRILIPSPKVATYDLKPNMSADEVTSSYISAIKTKKPDFICLNFANPDMVGHTGNMDAVVRAVEKIDSCLSKIVLKSLETDYAIIIIADHGNAELMRNKDKTPNTAHTTNKVPCFAINTGFSTIKPGSLKDIAPTILKVLNINKPIEMTGESLLF